MVSVPGKLTHQARSRIEIEPLVLSAVNAYEYEDLRIRGRLPGGALLATIIDRFGIKILGYPANLWKQAASLPPIHRDPVDRMLVAHAIADGLSIVTSDRKIHIYPVTTVW